MGFLLTNLLIRNFRASGGMFLKSMHGFFIRFTKVYNKNNQSNDRHSEHSSSDNIEQYFPGDSRKNTDDIEAPNNQNLEEELGHMFLISQLLLELR